LLAGAALVVEGDDPVGRARQVGDDAIRLPANQILQHRIGYLLKRPGNAG